MGGILAPAPLNLVDFLLNFKRLQVVELRLMGLEFRMELVLASLFLLKSERTGPCWERPAL